MRVKILFLYWLKNTGLILPLIFLFFVNQKFSKKIKRFYLPFLAIFILVNLFQFQPFIWDNIKFLLYWYLGSSILVGIFLSWIYKKNLKYVAFFLIFIQILSGFLSIFSEIKTKVAIFNKNDFQFAKKIREKTEPDAIFLAYPSHNNPIASLAGRKLFYGCPCFLWVHGIRYQQREEIQKIIYSGGKTAEKLIKENNIQYIFLGAAEKSHYKINKSFLNKFPKVLETNSWMVYNLKRDED